MTNKKSVEKKLMNVPIFVIIIRFVLLFVFIYLLFINFFKLGVLIMFLLVALTNFFSEIVIKKWSQITKINLKIKQILDRIFILIVVCTFMFYFFLHNKLDFTKITLLILIISREILSFPGVLINWAKGKDIYKSSLVGKITTVLQIVSLSVVILKLEWFIYFAILTALVGIISAINYLKYSLKK